MKRISKKVLWFGLLNLTLIMSWVVMMSCFNNTPQPNNQTVYVGANSLSGLSFTPTNSRIVDADNHAKNNYDDLEDLVTNPYSGNRKMYLQYGISVFNCTDHDHLGAISTSGSVSAVGFTTNTNNSGTMWLQFVSQCERDYDSNPNFGDGIYFKGTEWYGANSYPLTPQSNIDIDMTIITNCQYPWDRKSGATEYGCGSDDVNHND